MYTKNLNETNVNTSGGKVEQVFTFSSGDKKVVERVVADENLHYMHAIFNEGEGLPLHFSNANVYMSVIRGNLTIALDNFEPNIYGAGKLLKIPEGTQMNVKNTHGETLEIFIVKSPPPKG
ncbi:MAG: cupin domain-containing protein [Eubacteriales bacterium]